MSQVGDLHDQVITLRRELDDVRTEIERQRPIFTGPEFWPTVESGHIPAVGSSTPIIVSETGTAGSGTDYALDNRVPGLEIVDADPGMEFKGGAAGLGVIWAGSGQDPGIIKASSDRGSNAAPYISYGNHWHGLTTAGDFSMAGDALSHNENITEPIYATGTGLGIRIGDGLELEGAEGAKTLIAHIDADTILFDGTGAMYVDSSALDPNPPLSDANPGEVVPPGSADPGVSGDAARYDHLHGLTPGTGLKWEFGQLKADDSVLVFQSLFDANTILAANADNTPLALTVAEQTLVGRITAGNIDALTPAEARGVLGGAVYVPRDADPAVYDWDEGDLTTNGAAHDLDLSGIVPDKAVGVVLHVHVQDNTPGLLLEFRKNGNTNWILTSDIETKIANATTHGIIRVACDTNRVVEYRASNATWTSIEIVIVGWYLGE